MEMHEEVIARFIVSEFLPDSPDAELAVDLNLVEAGIVDSLGLLKVIAFLEEELRVSVPPEAMVPDNFSSIQTIIRLVTSLDRGGA